MLNYLLTVPSLRANYQKNVNVNLSLTISGYFDENLCHYDKIITKWINFKIIPSMIIIKQNVESKLKYSKFNIT